MYLRQREVKKACASVHNDVINKPDIYKKEKS
jgi:hypothetical protein